MKKIFSFISVFLVLALFSSNIVFAGETFSDIKNDKYETAISYLAAHGIINGYEDGTFKPNKTINRAELLKIIVESENGAMMGDFYEDYKNCFPDVREDWYADYVCYAKEQGWVKGHGDGYFRPGDEINKVEAVKIIVNVYELENNTDIELSHGHLENGAWYITYLEAARSNGLLTADEALYNPDEKISRGKVSDMIYKVLNQEDEGNEDEDNDNDSDDNDTDDDSDEGSDSDDSDDDDNDDNDDNDEIVFDDCDSFDTTEGEVYTVSTVADLQNALAEVNQSGNATILLEDGTYNFDNSLWLSGNNIIIRSQSGDREDVILEGNGFYGSTDSIFHVSGDNVTIADMTLRDVANHAIHIHGEFDSDNILMHNLHISDTFEQIVKVSSTYSETTSDNGILECSTLTYSAGIGPQYYIGGIDAHNSQNWIVRNNIFSNIVSPESTIAEHAIHFWSNSKNTLVENNIILNSDRGIGFGLGDRGHVGGIIRGNMIHHDSSFGDVGIDLQNASDAVVEDNIILLENDYANAIEYRFANSQGIAIENNTTNKAITSRDGGQATLSGNETNASIGWFLSPETGDFTLTN